MPLELPALPYAMDALTPHLSVETMEYHYGKHHRAYVETVNKLTAGTPLQNAALDAVVLGSEGPLFNAAAQCWNHEFYWNSMCARGGGAPRGKLADLIARDFGSYDAFKAAFKAAALGQFGSGWAWLATEGGKLKVMATANADLPMRHGARAIVTCDVWEHAYYVDYRNLRAKYVDVFLDHLVNWEWAERQLA